MKRIPFITLAIIFSFFLFPISNAEFSIPNYFHFRNISFAIFFLFMFFISYYFSTKTLHFFSYLTFLIFTLSLFFQKTFQTEFNFKIIIYYFTEFSYLIDDSIVFIKGLNIGFYIYIAFVLVISKFEGMIGSKKIRLILSIFTLIVFQIGFSISDVRINSPSFKGTKNIDTSTSDKQIYPIPEANIVIFCLEGVSRISLQNKNSKFFSESPVSGHHFFIPMPHSSKSLESFFVGKTNLETTRPDITKKIESSFLFDLKQIGYQTYFIYTQSLYFEDLFLFVPNFFDFVYGKEDLKKLGAEEIPGFSWGLDDDSLRKIFTKVNLPKSNPMFLWIGFSQTHSPYFPKSKRDESSIQNYNLAIQENLDTIDRIIESWNPPNQKPTFFILTSDHGESFGEEGAKNHNYSLFNQEIDVPFHIYIHPENKRYSPPLGSSKDFGESILWMVTNKKIDPMSVRSNSTTNLETEFVANSNFFQADYKLNLIGKTWNSNAQRLLIDGKEKYIYFADRDLLLLMDLNDENRKEVKDQKLKKKSIERMFKN
ncbi:MAG: sulfatase-like hydrolase/transferase [Leptospira sp.]|nr:sulfatase-like hydrolase/transferase [Leptospira sp.]